MAADNIRNQALNVASTLGKAALHAIAPDDFEYYACTFELIDSEFNIEEIFHFPVLPSSMSISRQSLASVKKTGRSYLSQFSTSYVGRSISINGTFGRRFRLLTSNSRGGNILEDRQGQFDLKVKTGYGSLKLLEKIIESSYSTKKNNSKLLLFHNMAFNQSAVVEIMNFQVMQSQENNMIWNYSIEMKGLADADLLSVARTSGSRLVNLLSTDLGNRLANSLFENII